MIRYVLASLLLCGPVVAGESCVTVAQDKATVEANHNLQYLGPGHIPFTDGMVIFYRLGTMTLASTVIDGCVAPGVFPVGMFKAEEQI